MANVVRIARRIAHASGVLPFRTYWGLVLRMFDRILAIAPYFLAWYWLSAYQPVGTESYGQDAWQVPAAGIAALLAGQMFMSYWSQLNSFLGSYAITIAYRARLINHLRRLPLGVFGRERVGELAAVLTDDVKRVEDVFTHLIAELVAALSVPVLFALALLWIDWRLTIALLMTWPLALLTLNAANRFFIHSGSKKQALFLETSGLLVEFVSGLQTLRLFNRSAEWLARLDERFVQIRRYSMGAEAWGGGSVQLYRLMVECGLPVLLLIAAWLMQHGSLTPVTWLLFVLTAYRLLDPLLDAAAFLVELRSLAKGENRLQRILDEPEMANGISEQGLSGHLDLAFEGVSFSYAEKWVLQGLSFRVQEGTTTAIVGPSGAGKSTVIELMARFHDPQIGSITLGGRDLREWQIDALYRNLSIVFQDVQLFDGSVFDNVRVGRQAASDDEVMRACRLACCDEFIQRLPLGYATPIGENGQQLSGGERQRLSIARALLRDTPVLLLDEATASVDPASQQELYRAIQSLVQGRTVIVVAHRLHTIRHVDQILVLDQGCLCEHGTHESLLALDGLYARLWRLQNQAIAEETADDVYD